MIEGEIIKVNIGCGPHGKSDWINLDWGILPLLSKLSWLLYIITRLRLLPKSYCQPWPSKPKLYDCRKKLPFDNSSVDFIYTSHFLEHIPRYQAIKFLTECRRILRPSGVLRVCVPDLKILIEKYLQNDIKFFKDMTISDLSEASLDNIADLFVQHFYGYDVWVEPTFCKKIQRRFIRGHLWMYDYNSLSDILRIAGFKNIHRCEPAQGKVPDISLLDIHRENSIFIEAF